MDIQEEVNMDTKWWIGTIIIIVLLLVVVIGGAILRWNFWFG